MLKIIAILVFGGGAPALLVFGMTSRIVFYRTRYEAYGFTASTYKNVYCISKSCFGKLIPGCAVPGFRRFFFALQPTGSGSYSFDTVSLFLISLPEIALGERGETTSCQRCTTLFRGSAKSSLQFSPL